MPVLNSLLLIYFLAQCFTNPTNPKKLVTRLIHKDSIISPFYNPKQSLKDRADRILRNSLARFDYLQRKGSDANNLVAKEEIYNAAVDASYEAKMEADDHGFLVNLSVGDPPVSQLLIMDTGSRLLWIQCKPCKRCFNQKNIIYDPSISSSYVDVACNDSNCDYIPNTECDHLGDCMYQVTYADNSSSRGQVGTEKFTLTTLDDSVAVLNDVVFGCGHDNVLQAGASGNGIIGLGDSTTSIVNKIGRRFSYCIGNVNDPNYLFNHLILGDDAIIEGYSTDLEIMNGYYYLSLEGISLGEERLVEIDSELFKRKWNGEGGTIIDSGTEFTLLNKVAFGVVRQKVERILSGFLDEYVLVYHKDMLCYQGKIGRDLMGFPSVTFHFALGADLVLDIDSLFYQINDDVFCMAIIPSHPNHHTIIGILAQQYYNVGYDLVEEKIFFQRIDCEALED